jgi:hypothetical protein
MKTILIAVALLGLTGGAYAGDFSDLAVNAAGLPRRFRSSEV